MAEDEDLMAVLSDEIMLRVFSNLPSPLHLSASLVCKKWLRLLGRLRQSLTLLEWSFLDRLIDRFPDLTELDLVPALISNPTVETGILLSLGNRVSFHLDPEFYSMEDFHPNLPSPETVDFGLDIVSRVYPSLRKLSIIASASDRGVTNLATNCFTLLELDLYWCKDSDLIPISAFENLQVLKIIGAGITDIGLTILAHGCKRLVKLDLGGCEGSYDGISAIGRCCLMLEELTLSDHRMDGGWIAGLPFCGNLKTLRMIGCRNVDKDPGSIEHLGSCAAIERLHLERCRLRDKKSLNALFFVCEAAKELIFQESWGLDDEIFGLASICRWVCQISRVSWIEPNSLGNCCQGSEVAVAERVFLAEDRRPGEGDYVVDGAAELGSSVVQEGEGRGDNSGDGESVREVEGAEMAAGLEVCFDGESGGNGDGKEGRAAVQVGVRDEWLF